MPFSIDAYLPAMPAIAGDFRTAIHHVEVTLGLFLFGSAVAQLIGGPFSDQKGRRLTALMGLSIYIVSSISLALAESITQFQLFRLCQALGAGFTTVVVGATVRARFSGNEAARIFALIGIIMLGAPLLAPIVGTSLLRLFHWQSIFVFLALYASVVFVAILVFFHPDKTTAKHRGQSPTASLGKVHLIKQILGNYARVLREHRALGFLFFQASSNASMFAFLTESSFIYMELYGASELQFTVFFAANIIAIIIFNRLTAFKLKTTDSKSILAFGVLLQLFVNASLLLLACWGLPTLWLFLPLVMLSVGSQGFITATTSACYMDYFKENSGVAAAVLGTSTALISAVAGFITVKLHDGLSIFPVTIVMFSATVTGALLLFALNRNMRAVVVAFAFSNK